jgi:hypothetical protein
MFVYTKEMHVSAHALYEYLMNLYAMEASANTGKKITKDQLAKGFKYKYKKENGKKSYEATVHIMAPVKNHLVKSSISGNGIHSEMSYLIEEKDPFSCTVSYTQDTSGVKEGGIASVRFRMDMKKRFNAIEKELTGKE